MMALPILLSLVVITTGNQFDLPPKLGLCTGDSNTATVWTAPAKVGGAPSTISANFTGAVRGQNCLVTAKDVSGPKSCDPNGHGCLSIGDCASAPSFQLVAANNPGTFNFVSDGKACVDFEEGATMLVQLYPCVNSPNQGWVYDGVKGRIKATFAGANGAFVGLETDPNCKPFAPPPPPPPPPRSPYCVSYHPIHDGNVYDPSGPLQDETGLWHTWEDDGSWSHWVSHDLIHWTGSFTQNTTNFGGDTGSVSPTPSGVYAFWPIMGGDGKGSIGSAKANDASLTTWTHRGPTIPMPARIDAGYRDPVRAFNFNGKWWQGVGCGSKEVGAQFCIFEASDDNLFNFTDRGSLYTTNITYGQVDKNIVWQPQNTSANMMECPDLFPLGDKWVLIGSLYKTNQWWVGTLVADVDGVPRFHPEAVGILDYGNGYAAKTGSEMVQSGTTRRVVFGFTGWSEPTTAPGCGRSLILPRDLSVSGSRLVINPIPETAALRVASTHSSSANSLANGSQVEIRVVCKTTSPSTSSTTAPTSSLPMSGSINVRVLASSDGTAYTEIGYDFANASMYADHSKCCGDGNTIIQRAPLSHNIVLADGALNMTVFVDGGTIEAFTNGVVITPLVSPSTSIAPSDRVNTFQNTASLVCSVDSWQLMY
eukprot:m.141267 g.141267  ORF g.141267 m.141267 type:complete len:650 (-) comp30173_c0_seq1:53-2002(-)